MRTAKGRACQTAGLVSLFALMIQLLVPVLHADHRSDSGHPAHESGACPICVHLDSGAPIASSPAQAPLPGLLATPYLHVGGGVAVLSPRHSAAAPRAPPLSV